MTTSVRKKESRFDPVCWFRSDWQQNSKNVIPPLRRVTQGYCLAALVGIDSRPHLPAVLNANI